MHHSSGMGKKKIPKDERKENETKQKTKVYPWWVKERKSKQTNLKCTQNLAKSLWMLKVKTLSIVLIVSFWYLY